MARRNGSTGSACRKLTYSQSTIISKCILQSVTTEAACSGAVNKAQKAIDNILHDNIVSLLTSLDAKVNDDGMVVLASYAQYFNAETTDCTHNQDWVFPGQAGSTSLLLTKDRRATFNSLVRNTNSVLKSAVKDASKKAKSKIVFADWDEWGAVTNGRFCEPGADPHPTDESNEDVLFFKLPTYKVFNPGTIFRREDEWDLVGGPNNYANISAAEEEEALGIQLSDVSVTDLDKRGSISPPACKKSALSGLLPDGIGRIFHPNEVGHETIASFVTWAIANARAKKLNVPSPACTMETEFTCYQGQGSKQYASAYSLYLHTADFCKSATEHAKDESSGWSFSKTYNKKTLDEATFSVSLDAESSDLDEKSCNAAVNRILDGCDGNDPENPMNWKFGGKYDTGGYTYSIAPQRKNRPFPVLKKPIGKCQGWYRWLYTRYNIRGAGWATWDSGQKTLRPNSTDCFGLGLTGWYFEYFDEPDENGFMWLAKFNSPIWTEARCYANNKVQSGAGGPSDGGCI